MASMVASNDVELMRKRKFKEVMRETDFKTMRDVVESHPGKFTVEILDKIPLSKLTTSKDDFSKAIDIHGSIKSYTRSVVSPPSAEMESLLLSAERIKLEKGKLLICLFLTRHSFVKMN